MLYLNFIKISINYKKINDDDQKQILDATIQINIFMSREVMKNKKIKFNI